MRASNYNSRSLTSLCGTCPAARAQRHGGKHCISVFANLAATPDYGLGAENVAKLDELLGAHVGAAIGLAIPALPLKSEYQPKCTIAADK